jgi:manganese efflux pump family protein
MEWAALILWILTAGGGFVLLAIWLKAGGMAQSASGRIRPVLILTHFALAATGLVLWIVYTIGDSSTVAWIAFALLGVVALIGFGMLGMWLSQRSRHDGEAAEQRFPVPIVGLHGLLAATTLVLVFLAAAGVG